MSQEKRDSRNEEIGKDMSLRKRWRWQETILSIKKAAINKKDWNPMKPGDGRGNRL